MYLTSLELPESQRFNAIHISRVERPAPEEDP